MTSYSVISWNLGFSNPDPRLLLHMAFGLENIVRQFLHENNSNEMRMLPWNGVLPPSVLETRRHVLE